MFNSIAKTPSPPYYAVIFTSLRTEGDGGYRQMAERMVDLAAAQPGFLGIESATTGSTPPKSRIATGPDSGHPFNADRQFRCPRADCHLALRQSVKWND